MQFGLFMMPLHPPYRAFADAYDRDIDQIVLADRLGFREAWIGEHITDAADLYALLIEDASAEDDLVLDNDGFRVFVDPFSAQYLNGVTIDHVSSMQGSGFTFKNPNATGGCGCGSSFNA